jgi:hypothetical protein
METLLWQEELQQKYHFISNWILITTIDSLMHGIMSEFENISQWNMCKFVNVFTIIEERWNFKARSHVTPLFRM